MNMSLVIPDRSPGTAGLTRGAQKSLFYRSSFIIAKEVHHRRQLTIDEGNQVSHADFIQNIQDKLIGKWGQPHWCMIGDHYRKQWVTLSDTGLTTPKDDVERLKRQPKRWQ